MTAVAEAGGTLKILKAQVGDLLLLGPGVRVRTGEIVWLFLDGASALVRWQDSGRTTRLWPGGDARIQHRELAELEVPEPRRRASRPAAQATQSPDKPIAGAPHPALR